MRAPAAPAAERRAGVRGPRVREVEQRRPALLQPRAHEAVDGNVLGANPLTVVLYFSATIVGLYGVCVQIQNHLVLPDVQKLMAGGQNNLRPQRAHLRQQLGLVGRVVDHLMRMAATFSIAELGIKPCLYGGCI